LYGAPSRDSNCPANGRHAAEAAGLVSTVRRGREKLHYLNAAPISDIAERWISRYDQPRVEALADLKKALEESAGIRSSRPSWPANLAPGSPSTSSPSRRT
jgi:hypothetical protein